LTETVGSTQPNVSKHLRVLQDAGLVKRRQQGTSVYYSIADARVFELCEMIRLRLRDRLEAQVGALNARLRA
jgi:DNA-binding transcriptional ArsR family regulator